ALKDGLVLQTAPGVYVDRSLFGGSNSQGDPSGNVKAPSGAPELDPADPVAGTIYDREEFAIWDAETASIPPHSYRGAVAGVTAALSSGAPERLEGVIAALAGSAGMEPEQAREYVETGIDWYAQTIGRD